MKLHLLLLAFLAGCNNGSFSGNAGRTSNPPPAKAGPVAPTPNAGGAKPAGSSANALPQTGTATGTASGVATGAGAGSAAAGIPDTPQDNVFANIDSACAGDAGNTGGILGAILGSHDIAPPQSPLPPTVPASCRTGFEINNDHDAFDLDATSPQGTKDGLQLEVDIATYQAPDRIRLLATDASGQQHVILDTCRLSTASYADPTDGHSRPPEDSVRYYRPKLPAGTTKLSVDFTGSSTPQYLRVIGLCEFSLSGPGSFRQASN